MSQPAGPLAANDTPTPGENGGGAETVASAPPVSLLVFRSPGGWFAVPAESVVEFVEDAPPVPLPMAPPHVPGLLMIRGRAVPLLSLESFLGFDAGASSGETAGDDEAAETFHRIVVVGAAEMFVGFRSQRVRGILEVPRVELKPPDALLAGRLPEFASHQLDDPSGLVAVLDLPRLLDAARIRP